METLSILCLFYKSWLCITENAGGCNPAGYKKQPDIRPNPSYDSLIQYELTILPLDHLNFGFLKNIIMPNMYKN